MTLTDPDLSNESARRRWGLPVSRSQIEDEVRAELEFHLEAKVDRLIESGLSPAQARAEAERRFGPLVTVEEECLDLSMQREKQRMRLELFTDLFRDLRQAVRSLRRRPGFTATAVLTVAIGLGAVTSIFSLLDAVVLRALPYPEPDRIAAVWGPYQSEAVYLGLSELDAFERLTAITRIPLTLTGDGDAVRIDGAQVTPNFFDTLGLQPMIGRPFSEMDSEPGAPDVTIVSERLANARFGRPDAALGQSLNLEGTLYEVVGVAPNSLRLPQAATQVWLPLPKIESRASGYHWGNYNLELLGRLADGVSPEAARLQTRARAKQLRVENPIWTQGEDYGDEATVTPLQTTLAGDLSRVLQLMMLAALAVLLIACVNVANLLLARSSARQHETSVRAALGASRGRLIASLLVESLVIAALGAAFGLAVAFGSVRLLTGSLPGADARFGDIGVDVRVLGFTLCATVLTALLFGLLPALRSSRVDLLPGIASKARGVATSGRALSRGLVVVQLALSVLLLFSSTLMLRSLWKLWNEPVGFSPETVLLARVDPVSGNYESEQKRLDLYDQMLDRLEQSSAVKAASASTLVPMSSSTFTVFDVPRLDFDPNNLPSATRGIMTPGYFETIGLPLLEGRDFDRTDVRRPCTLEEPCATIVNRLLAERIFQGEALGETMGIDFLGWFEIVGVTADARFQALSAEPTMAFFTPHAQSGGQPVLALELLVRANGEPMALESLVRDVVRDVDAQIAVDQVRTLSSTVRSSVSDTRFLAVLLTAFAGVSLLLAAVGIYGVISFMVEERRQEIGIRAALGARPAELGRSVVGQAVALGVAGGVIGALGCLGVLRLLATQLYETGGLEWQVLLGVPLLLFAVTVVSSWLPARRAATVDPAIALRQD